jgi:hypothetical protein
MPGEEKIIDLLDIAGLVGIQKEIVEIKSIENDFTIVINNNDLLPSIKYLLAICR